MGKWERFEIRTYKVRVRAVENDCMTLRPSEALRWIFSRLDADQEHLVVLALDANLHPIGFKVVASGGRSAVAVEIRAVFRAALVLAADFIIVAHNHPTGGDESGADVTSSERLRAFGEALGVRVVDSVVV